MSNTTHVKIVTADPSALGLFGLSLITLVASSQKLGLTSGTSFLIPWAFLLGGMAQVIASLQDYKHDNLFGATAFGAYGLFWIAMAFSWMIKAGTFGAALASTADVKQLGVVFIGFLIFSFYMTLVAMELSKALFAITALINVLFIGLALDSFGLGGIWHSLAAWAELMISLVGFYAGGAAVLNKSMGRVILPVGKPLGILKKH